DARAVRRSVQSGKGRAVENPSIARPVSPTVLLAWGASSGSGKVSGAAKSLRRPVLMMRDLGSVTLRWAFGIERACSGTVTLGTPPLPDPARGSLANSLARAAAWLLPQIC